MSSVSEFCYHQLLRKGQRGRDNKKRKVRGVNKSTMSPWGPWEDGHTFMDQAFLSLGSYLSSSFSMQITRCGTCCLGSLGIHWNSGSAWQSPGYCWQAQRHEVARDCVDLCSGKTVVSQDPHVHTLPERRQNRKVSLAESPHMNKA